MDGYGFVSFAKNIDKNATEVAKSMSNKYSQKLLDSGLIKEVNFITILLKNG